MYVLGIHTLQSGICRGNPSNYRLKAPMYCTKNLITKVMKIVRFFMNQSKSSVEQHICK